MEFLLSRLRIQPHEEKEGKLNSLPLLGPEPNGVHYIDDVHACVVADLVDTAVLVSGKANTTIQFECARCLSPFQQKISGDFKQNFNTDDDVIDVTYYLKESIVINFPIKPLCKENCRGLCPSCGKNLNIESCRCKEAPNGPHWKALDNLKFN